MMIRHFVAAAGVCLAALAPLEALQPTASGVEQLGWLAGCWTRTLADGVSEEQWMQPAGGSMLGMSRTVRRGRTTEFEFLRIAEDQGSLAYIAKPSGQAETAFAVKTLTEREVVFENAAHDFPQRVIYRRNADGSVAARIEGTVNGQPRGVDFPFTRCE